MTELEAMQNRHSVRSYLDQPLSEHALTELNQAIDACNRESGLHIQLVTNEPKAFDGFMAHYGKFSGVKNYIALIGKKSPDLDEKLGYYGERLALKAQMLGLNTCWVALTFSKGNCGAVIDRGEKLVCVIALGYGVTQGIPHRSKPVDSLCKVGGEMPGWFKTGMEAALLAPTATNQQKFLFTLNENTVQAKATGGFYSSVDLGIVRYHFEIGAGTEHFHWARE
jgi:nitroreductase